jgi:hypothetical protein
MDKERQEYLLFPWIAEQSNFSSIVDQTCTFMLSCFLVFAHKELIHGRTCWKTCSKYLKHEALFENTKFFQLCALFSIFKQQFDLLEVTRPTN